MRTLTSARLLVVVLSSHYLLVVLVHATLAEPGEGKYPLQCQARDRIYSIRVKNSLLDTQVCSSVLIFEHWLLGTSACLRNNQFTKKVIDVYPPSDRAEEMAWHYEATQLFVYYYERYHFDFWVKDESILENYLMLIHFEAGSNNTKLLADQTELDVVQAYYSQTKDLQQFYYICDQEGTSTMNVSCRAEGHVYLCSDDCATNGTLQPGFPLFAQVEGCHLAVGVYLDKNVLHEHIFLRVQPTVPWIVSRLRAIEWASTSMSLLSWSIFLAIVNLSPQLYRLLRR